LTWFVGPTKAKAYLKSGEKVVEEDVVVEPAKISSAVQEEPVLNQLKDFKLGLLKALGGAFSL